MKIPYIINRVLGNDLIARFVAKGKKGKKVSRRELFEILSKITCERAFDDDDPHASKIKKAIENGEININKQDKYLFDSENLSIKSNQPLYHYFQKQDTPEGTVHIGDGYKRLILAYLQEPYPKWNEHIKQWHQWEEEYPPINRFPAVDSGFLSVEDEFKDKEIIEGVWAFYTKKSDKIYRSYCHIMNNKDVKYINYLRKEVMEGSCTLQKNQQFILRLKYKDDPVITIFSQLRANISDNIHKALPSILVINRDERIFSRAAVLYRTNYTNLDNLESKVVTETNSEIEKQILLYLHNKKSFYTGSLKDNSLDAVNNTILTKTGRGTMLSNFRKKIGENTKWVSISRVPENRKKMALMHWEFQFDKYSHRCHVIRRSGHETGGTKYEGEAKIFQNHLWIDFHDSKGLKHKFFCAKDIHFNHQEKRIALGYTTVIDSNTGHANIVKEILLPYDDLKPALEDSKRLYNIEKLEHKQQENQIAENQENTQILYYSSFREHARMFPEHKVYLSYRDNATFSYIKTSVKNSQYDRQLRAGEKYRGKYLIYTINKYIPIPAFFKTTLFIDFLGISSLVKKYQKTKELVRYSGPAEQINDTLRIVLEHHPEVNESYNSSEEKRQFCEIKLHCTNPKAGIYVGLMSDTDINKFPDCSACIVVRLDAINDEIDRISQKGKPSQILRFISQYDVSYKNISQEGNEPVKYDTIETTALLNILQREYGDTFEKQFENKLDSLDQFFNQIGGVYFQGYKEHHQKYKENN